MEASDNQGQNPQPPNDNQYKKINAYTQTPSIEQVVTPLIFLVVMVLHSVFIVSGLAVVDRQILWILLGVTYVLLLLIAYDYIFLTCSDPVDDLILGIQKSYKVDEIKYCNMCKREVHQSSFHCRTCGRCSQFFDHHCKYLNNCIAGKNYPQFIRMLIVVTIFCVSIIGEGIWAFIIADGDGSISERMVSQWGVLASIIFTFITMGVVDSLLCFHFYLIFFYKKSTLRYIEQHMMREEMEGNCTETSKEQIAQTN